MVVAGLGNPGPKYAATRHNVGFMVIDELVREHGLKLKSKYKSQWAELQMPDGGKLILLKPTTFMNASGEALKACRRKEKWLPEQVLVIYDEVSLPTGRLRLRYGGSSGGHNGIKSILASFGGADFGRLRVGVDRPAHSADLADYVLAPFPEKEQELIEEAVRQAAQAVLVLYDEGYEAAMNKFNSLKPGACSASESDKTRK